MNDITTPAGRLVWRSPALTRIELAQTRGQGSLGGDGASQNGHG